MHRSTVSQNQTQSPDIGTPALVQDSKAESIADAMIPQFAAVAFALARQATLDAGLPVRESRDGHLVEILADGRQQILGPVTPAHLLRVGMRKSLRGKR